MTAFCFVSGMAFLVDLGRVWFVSRSQSKVGVQQAIESSTTIDSTVAISPRDQSDAVDCDRSKVKKLA